MRRKSVLWLLPFLAGFWLLTPPVLAPIYMKVDVWVAADEEFIYYATSPLFWGYSNWKTLAYCYVLMVDCRFWTQFKITFNIVNYVEWDSDDSITNNAALRYNETIDDTGFTVGYPRKMLIAFTGQDIGEDSYGCAPRNWTRGAVLVELWADWTDNILQHELTHLYSCNDTNVEGFDCVMNRYPTWIDFPFYMNVPYAMLTENWCTACKITFFTDSRIYRWGTWVYYDEEGSYGGGGGGGGGMPPFGNALEGDLNGTL